MARLGKWFTAGAFAIATLGAVPALAETAGSSPKMVELPIDGPLFMRETASGATVIISKDGRFVMPGRLVDRQENHAVISTVEEAVAAFSKTAQSVPGGFTKSSDLYTEDGFPNVDKLLHFTVGNGPKAAYVWVDPLCPYCHRVVDMQAELGEEFTFYNLIVPLLGERSERATDSMSCMPKEQRHKAMQQNQYVHPGKECDDQELANSQRLATMMQVEAVPTIISPNRTSVTGAPSTPEQLAQFLRGENQ